MISGYLRNARSRRIGKSQRRTSLVQSLQQQISRRAYAQEFCATHPERSLRHADLRTKLGQAEPLLNMFFQRFLEADHDGGVMVSRLGIVVRLIGGEAIMDDRVKELLFQRLRHLGARDQRLAGIGELAGLFEKTVES